MKTILTSVILVIFFLVGSVNILTAQTPEQLYQKGLTKEEGEGALQEAINLYNRVADNSNASLSLQAKALLHIGMCYEKLGMQEAVKAYQRLVNNYPAQKNEVSFARERLSRLVQVTNKVSEASLIPKFTKIKIPTRLSWNVALSPDGQYLAFVSDTSLWTMPLTGNVGPDFPGKPVQLNTEGVPVEWSGLAWSGDGKKIAFNEAKTSDIQGIFMVSSGGGKPQKIFENYRGARVVNYRISFSPDGQNLAYSGVDNNETHIYSKKLAGDSIEKLVDLQAREPVYSPDGKYIAYVEDKGMGRGGGNLWMVHKNDRNPILVAKAGNASSPVWSPDGSTIAFLDYEIKNQINFVNIPKGGELHEKVTSIDIPEGTSEARLLAGWTPENKIGALLVTSEEYALYTLPVKGGQAAMVLHNDIPAWQPRWYPDGKRIYYVTPDKKGPDQAYRYTLASVPSTGGKGNLLTDTQDEKFVRLLPIDEGIRFSPDGNTIVATGWTPDDKLINNTFPTTHIYKISSDGQKWERLTNETEHYIDANPSWSPDGKKIAFLRSKVKEGKGLQYESTSIFTINPSGGEPELLYSVDENFIYLPVWSPDGEKIFFFTKGKDAKHYLNEMNIDSGTTKILAEIPNFIANMDPCFSPDGKRLAFNDQKGIKIFNLTDGSIEDIETNLRDVSIYNLDWSSDGKQFVFGGVKGGNLEFWLMENFLPPEKLAQKNEQKDAREQEEIKIEQIPGVADYTSSISADGEYLALAEWETGNLAIRNLRTGEMKLATKDATWKEPMQYIEYTLISPDGKQVAYEWYNASGVFELRLTNVETQMPAILYTCDNNESVVPKLWFPDCGKVIAQRFNSKTKTMQLFSIDIANRDTQVLKENAGKYYMTNLSLSPDEKYIAYDFPDPSDQGSFDINLLSLDTKKELQVIKHPANDRLIGWLPGRNELLFSSDRSGTTDIWSVRTPGKEQNEVPRRIMTNIGDFDPVGFTQNGSLYYLISKINFESFIIPFDENGAKISMNSRTPLSGQVYDGSWLPDGKSIICNRYIQEQAKSGPPRLFVINTITGEARALALNLSITGQSRISPDGKSVLFFGIDKQRSNEKDYKGGIYIVNIETSSPVEIKVKQDVAPISCTVEWDREGKNIFYTGNNQVVKHNIQSGEEKIIYNSRQFTFPNIVRSSDGNNLLIDIMVDKTGSDCQLLSINENGGEAKILCTHKDVSNIRLKRIALSPDGKYIYFSSLSDDYKSGLKSVLYRIPSNGGTPENLWQSKVYFIAGMSIHPDGKKMAFSTFETGSDLRVITNLGKEIIKIDSKEK